MSRLRRTAPILAGLILALSTALAAAQQPAAPPAETKPAEQMPPPAPVATFLTILLPLINRLPPDFTIPPPFVPTPYCMVRLAKERLPPLIVRTG